MKELLGLVVNSISVNDGESVLKFSTDQGDKFFVAYGDCCSESWFADIIIDRDFKGQRVVEVIELELPEFVQKLIESDGRTRQEYDAVYGFKIKLKDDKSWLQNSIEIIFRNSSNGYYGGWVEYSETFPKGAEGNFKEITKNWTA